jgi:rhodanese-related sulfurtransferase
MRTHVEQTDTLYGVCALLDCGVAAAAAAAGDDRESHCPHGSGPALRFGRNPQGPGPAAPARAGLRLVHSHQDLAGAQGPPTDEARRSMRQAEAVTRRAAIDELLEAARKPLDRVQPADLASEIAAGALVVDTRPVEQRHRDGELPGALIIDRNVLEWRLDPTSASRIAEVTDPSCRIIIVCNEGYSSSLAAATLRQLGLERATDLVGGYQGWRRLTLS